MGQHTALHAAHTPVDLSGGLHQEGQAVSCTEIAAACCATGGRGKLAVKMAAQTQAASLFQCAQGHFHGHCCHISRVIQCARAGLHLHIGANILTGAVESVPFFVAVDTHLRAEQIIRSDNGSQLHIVHIEVIPVHILVGGGRLPCHFICAIQIDTGNDVHIHSIQHLAVVSAQGDHHRQRTFGRGRLGGMALGSILNGRLAILTNHFCRLLQGHLRHIFTGKQHQGHIVAVLGGFSQIIHMHMGIACR